MRILTALHEGLDDLFHPPATNVASLDVLRSAAILLVFTGHYVGLFSADPDLPHFVLFRWGWTGVDLFFVLSGYLIGAQLWKELDRTGRIRIGHFLLRRGLRIWPLYFAFVGFAAALYFFRSDIRRIWCDVFFVSNVPFFSWGFVAGGWSLSTEEQFYTLTPILLSLFALKLKPRRMWVTILGGLAVVIATRGWVIAHSSLPIANLRATLYYPSYTHADGLAVGMFLGWIVVFYKRLLQSRLFAALAVALMLVAGLVVYQIKPLLLNFTALGLIYGAMELYGISTLPFPGVLRWRAFYLISRLSFGLYLNHIAVITYLYPMLADFADRGTFGLASVYLLCLAASLLVAMVTFLFIEWPFLRIRARWVDRDKAVRAQLNLRTLAHPSGA